MFLLDTVVQRYWLPTSRPDPGVAPILLPFNPNVMKRYPVSGRINNPWFGGESPAKNCDDGSRATRKGPPFGH
jgi:hypothetical protein